MFKARYMLLVLALSTVGSVGFVLHSNSLRTAESLLAGAAARLGPGRPDYDAVLRDLDLALQLANAEGNDQLSQEILLTRAGVYRRAKVLDKAREDYELLAERYMLEDPSVSLQLAWIALDLEDWTTALAIAVEVLKKRPLHSEAHVVRGRGLHLMGEATLEKAQTLLDARLDDADAARARRLTWRASTLDPGHPHREATLNELAPLFAGKNLTALHEHLEVATACLTQARSSYVASLDTRMNTVGLVNLLVLLEQGGQWNDVVNIGVAGTAHAQVQRRLDALQSLVLALDELDRPAFASSILSQAAEDEIFMPIELLETWCKLLYESENWKRLGRLGDQTAKAAKSLEGRTIKSAAAFFSGWAKLNRGDFEDAEERLLAYVNNPLSVPVPDAVGIAYHGLSMCARERRSTAAELRYLEHSAAAAPRLDPAIWLRLSEVQIARKQPFSEASESIAQALNVQGSDHDQILPIWDAVSEQAMDEANRTIAGVRRVVRARDAWIDDQAPAALSWEHYQLGREYLASGLPYGAIHGGRAILRLHPDHVLGLDLIIEGEARRGSWSKVVETLIRRAEIHGPHPDTLSLIAAVPEGAVQPEQMLVLMKLDPKVSGLSRMVDSLRSQGRDSLAIMGLRSIPPAERHPTTSLLLAQLLLTHGREGLAMETAALIPSTSPEYARAIELSLLSAQALGRKDLAEDQLIRFIEEVEGGTTQIEVGAARRIAHLLLGNADAASAVRLMAAFDQAERRTGPALITLALAELVRSGPEDAESTLYRAEPFVVDHEAYLARILLLAQADRWTEIPAEIKLLRKSGYVPAPWVDAVMQGLSERVAEAANRARQALAAGAPEPAWLLVAQVANALLPDEGSDSVQQYPHADQTARFVVESDRDARMAWIYLLAHETPSGSAWLLAQLGPKAGQPQQLWATWLCAGAFDRLGHGNRRNQLLESLLLDQPDFVPAWDRLHADLLARLGSPLLLEHTAFLQRRLQTLGPDPDHPAWNDAALAHTMTQRGKPLEAVTLLMESNAVRGADAMRLVTLARTLASAKDHARAVLSLGEAFGMLDAQEAVPLVEEFLEFVDSARSEGQLSGSAWRAQLQALLTQLPRDPRLSLAWAEFEQSTADNPTQGWTRARAEYERFREETEWQSLDTLHPGSAAAWAAFFLAHDPRDAELMILDELPRSPGSPDLWRLHAQALEVQGKIDEAFDRYVALINILPEPETMRLAAEILAQRGSDHPRLVTTLQHIQDVEGVRGPDPRLEILRARSLANSGMEGVRRALPLYEGLWKVRELIPSDSAQLELSAGLAVALLHRGDPSDAKEITGLLDHALGLVETPYRRDILRVYRNLAQVMPERPPEEEPEEEAAEEGPDEADGDPSDR